MISMLPLSQVSFCGAGCLSGTNFVRFLVRLLQNQLQGLGMSTFEFINCCALQHDSIGSDPHDAGSMRSRELGRKIPVTL